MEYVAYSVLEWSFKLNENQQKSVLNQKMSCREAAYISDGSMHTRPACLNKCYKHFGRGTEQSKKLEQSTGSYFSTDRAKNTSRSRDKHESARVVEWLSISQGRLQQRISNDGKAKVLKRGVIIQYGWSAGGLPKIKLEIRQSLKANLSFFYFYTSTENIGFSKVVIRSSTIDVEAICTLSHFEILQCQESSTQLRRFLMANET